MLMTFYSCASRMRHATQMCDLYNSYTIAAYRQPEKTCPVYVFIYILFFSICLGCAR